MIPTLGPNLVMHTRFCLKVRYLDFMKNIFKGPYRSRGNRSEMARPKNAPKSNHEKSITVKSPSFSEVLKALFCIGEPFKEIKLWAKIPPRMRYRLSCSPDDAHAGSRGLNCHGRAQGKNMEFLFTFCEFVYVHPPGASRDPAHIFFGYSPGTNSFCVKTSWYMSGGNDVAVPILNWSDDD